MDIQEMKKKRLQFLHKLYDLAKGSEYEWFDKFEIGYALDFNKDLTVNIANFLNGERLIVFRTSNNDIISISYQGVLEVEKVLDNPDMPTKYFPPSRNIIIVEQMFNSQIQQGSPRATQMVIFSKNRQSDLRAEIYTIEAQMSSSRPKPTIITESLSSIRNILEGAAGSIISSELLSKVIQLL